MSSIPPRRDSRAPALGGFAGGVAVTVGGAVLHTLAPAVPFLPVALTQVLVRTTPGGFDSFFIDRLGHWASRLALLGTCVAFLALAAALATAIPFLGRRLPGGLPGAASFLPLWGISVGLYPTDPQSLGRWAFAAAVLPLYLAGGAVAAAVSCRLHAGPRGDVPTDMVRRYFLRSAWFGAAGLALGVANLGNLTYRGSDPGLRRLAGVLATEPPTPRGAASDAAFAKIPGLSAEITPNAEFYVVSEDIIQPSIDPAAWRLSVGGLVQHPLELTYRDLRSLHAAERYQTLECISNQVGGHYMSTAAWAGVPLAEILDRAGPGSNAVEVVFGSAGGYSDSMSIAKALDETTLIAFGMNGFELPGAHGFPARVLGVGTYGMKNPKWLTSIRVVDRPYGGVWEQRGWSKPAIVRTSSRIDTPVDGATVGRDVPIAGVAFAGDREISKVEVSTDGGRSWNTAVLKTPLSKYSWRLWLYRWTPSSPRKYRIVARAHDGLGSVQTPTPSPPFPNGAGGEEGVSVTVR